MQFLVKFSPHKSAQIATKHILRQNSVNCDKNDCTTKQNKFYIYVETFSTSHTCKRWRNFRFVHIWCGEIRNFSICGETSDFSISVTFRNLKYLHMANFSTDIMVVLVTNMRYVVHGHWQFLVLPSFLSSFLSFYMFHVMLPMPSFCHVLHEFDKYWIRRKSDDKTSRLVKICIAFKTFWQKQHWLFLDI